MKMILPLILVILTSTLDAADSKQHKLSNDISNPYSLTTVQKQKRDRWRNQWEKTNFAICLAQHQLQTNTQGTTKPVENKPTATR